MPMQSDRLIYAVMLRQFNVTSDTLRAAYHRLEMALSSAANKHPRTVILDWAEAELMSLHRYGNDEGDIASLLLKEIVALNNLVKG